jgi:hypothetical protein
VESAARNEQYRSLTLSKIGTNDPHFASAVHIQQEHFEPIAQVMVIHLIRANAMESHGRFGRHQKIKHVAKRPAPFIAWRQHRLRQLPIATIWLAHETASRGPRQLEQLPNFSGRWFHRNFSRSVNRLARDAFFTPPRLVGAASMVRTNSTVRLTKVPADGM